MALPSVRYRLSDEPRSFGLSCTANGLSLAGVPLLDRGQGYWHARTSNQIRMLIKQAYLGAIDPVPLISGLGVVADCLNQGETPRAMIAAVLLKLPELDWDGAVRIAQANDALEKFDPDELRDQQGCWTAGGDFAPNPANDQLQAPGHGGRFPRVRPPLGLSADHLDDAELLDVGLNDAFHNEVRDALAEHFKADGLIVATEVGFLDDKGRYAIADIVAMKPGDPTTLAIVEVKTGPRSHLNYGQSWVYPGFVHGGLVSSFDRKIDAFGIPRGVPLPPSAAIIWYEESPGSPRVIERVPIVFPYNWHPPK